MKDISEKTIRDVLEHYKFWFKRELENREMENIQFNLEDILQDRINLIERIAISLEIDIGDTWDENIENIRICDICDEAIPPIDYCVFHGGEAIIHGHFDCIDDYYKNN